MPPVPANLQHLIAGTRFGPVEWYPVLESTNATALIAARSGSAAGLVVVADHQTAGRGRLGRTWTSAPGAALLVSVVLEPDLPVDRRHLVVLAAAVAMADAVGTASGVAAVVKWPNDLLVGDRKLAGVLAESSGAAVIVGIGVNVDRRSVPPGLDAVATALELEGAGTVGRPDLLGTFLVAYDAWLDDLAGARAAARDRSATLGRPVRVERPDGVVEGVAVDIGEAGELLVEVDGRTLAVHAGDVTHLR